MIASLIACGVVWFAAGTALVLCARSAQADRDGRSPDQLRRLRELDGSGFHDYRRDLDG